jgi:hypothetical protein
MRQLSDQRIALAYSHDLGHDAGARPKCGLPHLGIPTPVGAAPH